MYTNEFAAASRRRDNILGKGDPLGGLYFMLSEDGVV